MKRRIPEANPLECRSKSRHTPPWISKVSKPLFFVQVMFIQVLYIRGLAPAPASAEIVQRFFAKLGFHRGITIFRKIPSTPSSTSGSLLIRYKAKDMTKALQSTDMAIELNPMDSATTHQLE